MTPIAVQNNPLAKYIPDWSQNNPVVNYITGWALMIETRWINIGNPEGLYGNLVWRHEALQQLSQGREFDPYRERISSDLRIFKDLMIKNRATAPDLDLHKFLDAHSGLALLALTTADPISVYFNLDCALMAGALRVRAS